MLLKIHCRQRLDPDPGGERRDHDLVERTRRRAAPPANSAERMSGNVTYRIRLEGVGTEVGRRLVEVGGEATQPGEDVVVDDDDAEGRVRDDQGEEAERIPPG